SAPPVHSLRHGRPRRGHRCVHRAPHGRGKACGFACARRRCLLSIITVWTPIQAQQVPKVPKIGYLSGASPAGGALLLQAFREGMGELGYIEGKTFVLEVRFADGKSEAIPQLARELVALKADVVVASTDAPIAAVKRETRAIPIVMTNATDPVGTGFVASLAHPGGNVTGLSNISADLSGKRLELLRELVPGLSRVVFVWDPDSRGAVLECQSNRRPQPVRCIWSFNR